jgi:AcrR family transcriptional regulator
MEKLPKRREPSGRGSPEVWLDAAYDLLIESGVDAIRIVPLAEKLQLARTSFYWFFEDRSALLDALLSRWRSVNTANLVQRTELYAESITEAIFNVFDCWLNSKLFDSRFEFSIRSWALQSPDVAAEIRIVDGVRIDALTKMFLRFGFDPLAADVRARSIYMTQIGYISMKSEEDLATRMTRIPDYVQIFTGQAALPRELDRFFARHEYSPTEKPLSPPPKRSRKT